MADSVVVPDTLPGFEWYRDAYGGELSAEAFSAAIPGALRAVRLACGIGEADVPDGFLTLWRRAVCAAAEAVAEYGEGQVGGFTVGSFRMGSATAAAVGETGREAALRAALAEMAGSGLAFGGVR